MNLKKLYIPLLLALAACRPDAEVPTASTPVEEQAAIYPDYRDITIPPNIAPLNLQVKSEGTAFVGQLSCNGTNLVAAAGEDGKLAFDPEDWRKLLNAARGKDISVRLYAERNGSWISFPAYKITVAPEEIDRYLSYRLIEPSYELYRQLGIYQRDLETFDVKTVYENNREYENKDNHCINCHNYQNYDTKRMLFHVRANHGGTVFVTDGKAKKLNMKCDSILSSTVYPSWHPTQPWVVFSSNQTGQAFHMVDKQKVEVMDFGSDLVFYDAEKQTLTNILKTDAELETFPCWTPDGHKLFYCSATVPIFAGKTTEQRQDLVLMVNKQIRYRLMSLTFDPDTRTFGQPQVEYDSPADTLSCAMPRVSPDGRYVLFTLAPYGQFHIWHQRADLYVKDLANGQVRRLNQANSPLADSNHCWSSNGRWIVVASRRDDGSYSRPYIAYFDKQGSDRKAFLLPQLDPEQNIMLNKSYNLPELTKNAVSVSQEELTKVVMDDENLEKVAYKSK